jgi:hypothetical protein
LSPKRYIQGLLFLGFVSLGAFFVLYLVDQQIKSQLIQKANVNGLSIFWRKLDWGFNGVHLHDVSIFALENLDQNSPLFQIEQIEVKSQFQLQSPFVKINQILIKKGALDVESAIQLIQNKSPQSQNTQSQNTQSQNNQLKSSIQSLKSLMSQVEKTLEIKNQYEDKSKQLQRLDQTQHKQYRRLRIEIQQLKNQCIQNALDHAYQLETELKNLGQILSRSNDAEHRQKIIEKLDTLGDILIENIEIQLPKSWLSFDPKLKNLRIDGMISSQLEHDGALRMGELGFQWKINRDLTQVEIFALKEWQLKNENYQISLKSIILNAEKQSIQLNALKLLTPSDLQFNLSLLLNPYASILTGKVNIPHWESLTRPFQSIKKNQDLAVIDTDMPIKPKAIQFPIDIDAFVPWDQLQWVQAFFQFLSLTQYHLRLKNLEISLPNEQMIANLSHVELKDSVLSFNLQTQSKSALSVSDLIEEINTESETEVIEQAQQLKAKKKISNEQYLSMKDKEEHLNRIEQSKKKIIQDQIKHWVKPNQHLEGSIEGHLQFSPKGLVEQSFVKWKNLSISSLLDWKPLVNADLSGSLYLLPLWKSSHTDLEFEKIWLSARLENGLVDEPITEGKVGGIDGQIEAWMDFQDVTHWQVPYWKAWRHKLAVLGKFSLDKQLFQFEAAVEPTSCQNAYDSIPKGFWGLYQNAKLSAFNQKEYFDEMQTEKKKLWGKESQKLNEQLSAEDSKLIDLLNHPEKQKDFLKIKQKEIEKKEQERKARAKEKEQIENSAFSPKFSFSIALDNAYSLKTQLRQFKYQCRIDSLNSLMPKTKLIKVNDKPANLSDVNWIKENFAFRMLPNVPSDTEIWVGPATGNEQYTYLTQMPRYVGAAMYLTEEMNFWNGGAISPELMTRGMRLNLNDGRFVYGGSTITQQLVKNIFLTRKKYLSRKLQETLISSRMIDAVPKERVLELYLNCIEFGPSVYGITKAAAYYFQKHPSQLRPREAVFLAMLKPYPLGGGTMKKKGVDPQYPSWQDRYAEILDRLYKGQHITKEQMEIENSYQITWIDGIYQAPTQALPAYEEGNLYVASPEEINALKIRLKHHH